MFLKKQYEVTWPLSDRHISSVSIWVMFSFYLWLFLNWLFMPNTVAAYHSALVEPLLLAICKLSWAFFHQLDHAPPKLSWSFDRVLAILSSSLVYFFPFGPEIHLSQGNVTFSKVMFLQDLACSLKLGSFMLLWCW